MYCSPHQLVRFAHQLALKAGTGSMGRMAEMLAAQKQQRELEQPCTKPLEFDGFRDQLRRHENTRCSPQTGV